MGISKLNCTLKGEVPPKWLLYEDTPDAINRRWRMWEKFSIISSLCRMRACSSNKLIESSTPSFFIFFCHWGFLRCARAIVLERDKLKTQLSILGPCRGHALKNNQELPPLIQLIQIILDTKWERRYNKEMPRDITSNTLFLLMK